MVLKQLPTHLFAQCHEISYFFFWTASLSCEIRKYVQFSLMMNNFRLIQMHYFRYLMPKIHEEWMKPIHHNPHPFILSFQRIRWETEPVIQKGCRSVQKFISSLNPGLQFITNILAPVQRSTCQPTRAVQYMFCTLLYKVGLVCRGTTS